MSIDSGGEKCRDCDGCGKVADTKDREPWTAWTSLPIHSGLAVLVGVVKPIPCPECLGTGDAKAAESIRYLVAQGFTADDYAKALAERAKGAT